LATLDAAERAADAGADRIIDRETGRIIKKLSADELKELTGLWVDFEKGKVSKEGKVLALPAVSVPTTADRAYKYHHGLVRNRLAEAEERVTAVMVDGTRFNNFLRASGVKVSVLWRNEKFSTGKNRYVPSKFIFSGPDESGTTKVTDTPLCGR
jgi:hypothetical protein